MPKKSFTRIYTKRQDTLIRWLIVLTGIILLGILLFTMLRKQQILREEAEIEQLSNMTTVLHTSIQNDLLLVDRALATLVYDMAEWRREDNSQYKAFRRLRAMRQTLSGVSAFYLVLDDGYIWAASYLSEQDRYYPDSPFLDNIIATASLGRLYLGPPNLDQQGLINMTAVKRLAIPGTELTVTAIAMLNPASFSTLLKSVLYTKDTIAAIYYEDGTVFALADRNGLSSGMSAAAPQSLFNKHKAEGFLSSIQKGKLVITGDSRVIAFKTIASDRIILDTSLTVAISRNYSVLITETVSSYVLVTLLYLVITILVFAGLIILERRRALLEQERERNQRALKRLAHHDPLTGLPNRRLLSDRLRHAILRCQRNSSAIAIIFLDMDGFKEVNDQYGHETGDALLIALSRRMASCIRATDTLARLGGDEFIILLEPIKTDKEVAISAERVLASIYQDIPLTHANEEIHITVSVSAGISLFMSSTEVETVQQEKKRRKDIVRLEQTVLIKKANDIAERLLNEADQAMYRAKRSGKNRFVFFKDATATPESSSAAEDL